MNCDDDYDLEVLLKLRKEERDQNETRYAEAMERHRTLGQEVERLEQQHRQMVRDRKRACRTFDEALTDGPATMERMQRFDRHVAGLKAEEEKLWQRLEKARQERRRARRTMERVHDELLASVRQLKAVQKHRETWCEEKALEQKRRRSAAMDDVAARMWRDGR